MAEEIKQRTAAGVIPTGSLKNLRVSEIKPSRNNPRQLFDPEPLRELKESIKSHGVLVPITVYKNKGQEKYSILDGERRYRCCAELEDAGLEIEIPANIVEPPDKIAGLLYMFSIHNFREQWELMPTALSLKTVMKELRENDNKKLSNLTGLSETQIERCKILLSFPEKFQALSLNPEPSERIPSNFWIEAYPVIKIYEVKLPELVRRLGREALIEKLVAKYRKKKIVSVIHFRRVVEADEKSREPEQKKAYKNKLTEYINKEDLETREAFDEFLPPRNIKSVIDTCNNFVERLKGFETQLTTDANKDFVKTLKGVQSYIAKLLNKMEGGDAPGIK